MLFLRCARQTGESHTRSGFILVFGPGARMGFVVYLGQMLKVKVRVDLGRRDIGVAEKSRLYRSNIVMQE